MKKEWAVCFNPITWGEVIWKHKEKIRILVGGAMRDFSSSAVLIFGDVDEAKECYGEAMAAAERVKTGI